MDKVNLTTHSEEETMAFGEWIGAHAVNDLFIALNGDLGTGKTHFVQGLAKGMGINDDLSGTERPVSFPIKDLGDAQATEAF